MVIRSNSRVGIGTTAPGYLLEVNGSAGKPGGGLWSNSSDRRLKQNVKDYSDGLEEVLAIKPVTYNYNELSDYDTKPEYVGVIAQELNEIAPYMVSSYDKDGTDYLNVDASAMTFMLVNAVKEQQEIIEAQREENEKQQSEIEAQQSEIEALKAKADEVDVLKAANIEMKAEIDNIKSVLGIDSELTKNK